jgi:prepilin-type N-terminal cleavage/methylation domain-containing protein
MHIRVSSDRSAFTLTELLVVIVIVAILAGVIIPVTGIVQKKSRTVSAVSNLRQCYVAFTNYVMDNHGILPGNEGNDLWWKFDLLPYIGDGNKIPNNVSTYGDPNHRAMYPDRHSEATFTMSGFIGPKAEGVEARGATRLSEMVYPEEVVLLMQGKHFDIGEGIYFAPAAYPGTGTGFPPDEVYDNDQVLVMMMTGYISFWDLANIPTTPYGPEGYFWSGLERSWWPTNWHANR